MELKPYQREAVEKMHNGCILNGGVGSGKSFTALAYYYKLYGGDFIPNEYILMDDISLPDLYIITTARKRDTREWELELSNFLMHPDKEFDIYNHKVVVDSWNNIGKYKDVEGAFFIFDEQRVVGKGAWVKSFLTIVKHNQWILLSATPGDTWVDYIPVFIANGFYRNRTEFEREHIVWKRYSKFPQIDKYMNVGRLIRLRNRILVDMDFDRQTEAIHRDVIFDYDIKEYKRLMRERCNKDGLPYRSAGELCYALRKCVNTMTDKREESLYNIINGHQKAIIFYNFDYELEDIKDTIDNWTVGGVKLKYAEWNGHKHQPLPTDDYWVYLVQYTAGCEGWNCITTDCIIFYSQTYSYKQLAQAEGRIDRLNTPYHYLYYYHMKTRAPIDIAINRALKSKKNFNEGKFLNS